MTNLDHLFTDGDAVRPPGLLRTGLAPRGTHAPAMPSGTVAPQRLPDATEVALIDWAPGVYRDVAMDTYHRLPGLSASQLKELARSPAHLRAYLDGLRTKSTDATEFGTALHCALLEPEHFNARYTVAEQCFARTKSGERCSRNGAYRVAGISWFCSQHLKGPPDVTTAIAADDLARVRGARDAILRHPAAEYVFEHVVARELTVFWRNAAGVLCRMRVDAVAPALGATVEVKSAVDASISGFKRAIYRLRYYWQGAFYLEGANAVLAEDPAVAPLLDPRGFFRHIIIAAEKVSPFAVNVFPMRDDAIQAGRDEMTPLIAQFAECHERDEWPQQSSEYRLDMEDVSLPPWAWREIDERLERMALTNGGS